MSKKLNTSLIAINTEVFDEAQWRLAIFVVQQEQYCKPEGWDVEACHPTFAKVTIKRDRER
jgi:hypothetical protein